MQSFEKSEWILQEMLMKRQFLIDRSLYQVVVKKDHENHGDVDLNKKVITLNDESPDEMLSTLIHELLHAVDYEYCANSLKHWQIYQLEKGIKRLLVDNFGDQD